MLESNKKLPIEENTAKTAKSPRREQNSLDDAFIVAYCERPMDGKTAALIKAGFVGDNIPQEAYRMFKRLSDQIKERTSVLIESLDALAASQMLGILTTDVKEVGYANMRATCKDALEYNGRKPGDTLTIKKEQTIDDIDTELQSIRDQIKDKGGKELH